MNLVLLLPAALAALAALALPLLLHLARRQQQRPTAFAALRWLQANPKPRRRIRFDEWWLLLVRLLLVAALALLLARPALLGVEDETPRLLVVPGVAPSAIADATAQAGESDARWLAPGFPPVDRPTPQGRFAIASLLREFDATLPAAAPLTVLVPERLRGADAARLRLARAVDWRVMPADDARVDVAPSAPPVLAIRHDEAHREAVRYLRAATLAWQDADARTDVAVSADVAGPLPDDAQVLAWLRSDPLPAALRAWVGQGGRVLVADDAQTPVRPSATVVWRDAAGRPLLTAAALEKGRVLRFTRPLQPDAMPELLDPGFPARLRDVLQPVVPPTLVVASDYAPASGAVALPAPPRELSPWLALAIALLALLERWLATSPRRSVAA
ncbi:BatA domain-containing protein [Luteimonas saliphila]|uniref:BatA domain-containing protein n=1 Tax=Luteimonas saliphila TaxID=2804919 RepID=UPI00192D88E4|nr:BatA domain-containing protein [Luteimonas saliphila]